MRLTKMNTFFLLRETRPAVIFAVVFVVVDVNVFWVHKNDNRITRWQSLNVGWQEQGQKEKH